MKFDPPLAEGRLIKRYKRFLADIALADGKKITVHCPNTGSMKACVVPDSPCWFSTSANPKRKYPYTWEIARTDTGDLAGINTSRANQLVKEAIENSVITELQHYSELKAEVKYGTENSRIDFLLTDPKRPPCYVEVKNVTLGMTGGQGLFPDAVSARGSKHLRELMGMVAQGQRAVLLYCVQHTGIQSVSPAKNIDPDYAATLKQVVDKGVEVIAYKANISETEIVLNRKLPVVVS
ncbi:MAG: DNA/RNA nuclease SfsA [Pseudomonadota bacterium]